MNPWYKSAIKVQWSGDKTAAEQKNRCSGCNRRVGSYNRATALLFSSVCYSELQGGYIQGKVCGAENKAEHSCFTRQAVYKMYGFNHTDYRHEQDLYFKDSLSRFIVNASNTSELLLTRGFWLVFWICILKIHSFDCEIEYLIVAVCDTGVSGDTLEGLHCRLFPGCWLQGSR